MHKLLREYSLASSSYYTISFLLKKHFTQINSNFKRKTFSSAYNNLDNNTVGDHEFMLLW